jgi:O-acetylserine/cysteine efflux transporter
VKTGGVFCAGDKTCSNGCDNKCDNTWRIAHVYFSNIFESSVLPIRHIFLAITVAFIYGVAFVAIKQAVLEMPPLQVTGWRFLITAVPLVFFIKPPKVAFYWTIAFGLVQGALFFGLIFTSISWGMPGGLASLVAQLQVFFTIGIAAFLFHERPLVNQYIGAGVALLGIVLTGWSKFQDAAPLLPFMMVVLAAALWGAANIIAKAARPPDMLAFIIWGSLAAPVPLFLASMIIEGTSFAIPASMPSFKAIAAVMFMAYAATVFAFTAWNWLLRQYPASTVTPFALLIPIFGFSSMAVVFGERISALTMLGAVIVFIGLAINVFGAKLFPSKAAVSKAKA